MKTKAKTTVGATTIGAAVSVLAVWIEGLAGLSVPPEVAAAQTTIFVAGFGLVFPL